jgi:transcription initiation factor TFIIE subunit alpha
MQVLVDSMAMITDDVLRHVATIIGGEVTVDIAMALWELQEATSDQILMFHNKLAKITEKPELKLNDIRRSLFMLYENSIVQCDRSRDTNSGWFIFRWRLQLDQIAGFTRNRRRRILKILRIRLLYEETKEFYHCGTPECRRIPFEDAVELVFRCPTCNNPLQHSDNSELIEALKKKIEQLDFDQAN